MLERCLASVRRQSPAVDHLVIADGFPQDWIDALPVRHLKLDRAHGDYGNAARGLGALLAVAEGYDGIAFLDADNWYDDDHVASCLMAAEGVPDAAYVIAQRRFCRPDASAIAGTPADAPHSEHVDTNCHLLFRDSFDLLHRWCTIPNRLAAYGDQVFGKILRAGGLRSAMVSHRTVNYLCLSEAIYQQNGETPPPGCKPIIRWRDAQAWIHALPNADRRHLERMIGLTVAQIDPEGPAGGAVPDASHISVEIPGTPHPARLRRTSDDVAAYRRIFIEGFYGSADLPATAALIVDAAAGIGLAALHLHARYPDAAVIAAEPDPEAFELLAANLRDRNGCSPIHARIAAQPAPPASGTPPALTLAELLGHLDARTVDLLRLSPEQWQGTLGSDLSWVGRVRTVLVEGPGGVDCIDPASVQFPAQRPDAAESVADEPVPSLAA